MFTDYGNRDDYRLATCKCLTKENRYDWLFKGYLVFKLVKKKLMYKWSHYLEFSYDVGVDRCIAFLRGGYNL